MIIEQTTKVGKTINVGLQILKSYGFQCWIGPSGVIFGAPFTVFCFGRVDQQLVPNDKRHLGNSCQLFRSVGIGCRAFCAKGQPRAQVAITGILCVGRFVSDCWIDHGIFRLGWWNSCGWCHYARFCHWMGGLSAHDRVGPGPKSATKKGVGLGCAGLLALAAWSWGSALSMYFHRGVVSNVERACILVLEELRYETELSSVWKMRLPEVVYSKRVRARSRIVLNYHAVLVAPSDGQVMIYNWSKVRMRFEALSAERNPYIPTQCP